MAKKIFSNIVLITAVVLIMVLGIIILLSFMNRDSTKNQNGSEIIDEEIEANDEIKDEAKANELDLNFESLAFKSDLDKVDLKVCQELNEENKVYELSTDILNANGNCFVVKASNIIIDGKEHIISGNNEKNTFGIISYDYSNITVQNLIVKNFDTGILLADSTHSIIQNNKIFENGKGVDIQRGENNSIISNEVSNNLKEGIFVSSLSLRVEVTGNIADYNEKGMEIIGKFHTIKGNTANHNSDGKTGIGIVVKGDKNKILANTAIGNSGQGMHVAAGEKNIVENNIIKDNQDMGLVFAGSNNNNVSGNVVCGNTNFDVFCVTSDINKATGENNFNIGKTCYWALDNRVDCSA
jgi:parallel beta-helix repeat protein